MRRARVRVVAPSGFAPPHASGRRSLRLPERSADRAGVAEVEIARRLAEREGHKGGVVDEVDVGAADRDRRRRRHGVDRKHHRRTSAGIAGQIDIEGHDLVSAIAHQRHIIGGPASIRPNGCGAA